MVTKNAAIDLIRLTQSPSTLNQNSGAGIQPGDRQAVLASNGASTPTYEASGDSTGTTVAPSKKIEDRRPLYERRLSEKLENYLTQYEDAFDFEVTPVIQDGKVKLSRVEKYYQRSNEDYKMKSKASTASAETLISGWEDSLLSELNNVGLFDGIYMPAEPLKARDVILKNIQSLHSEDSSVTQKSDQLHRQLKAFARQGEDRRDRIDSIADELERKNSRGKGESIDLNIIVIQTKAPGIKSEAAAARIQGIRERTEALHEVHEAVGRALYKY